jgi:multidrug efflux system outer membrane protein
MAPRYQRPAAPVPARAGAPQAAPEPAAAATTAARDADALGWRDVFGDPRLQALIALSLQHNRDLRVAALNVELLQAQYRIQRGALLPQVTASGVVARQHVAADQSPSGKPATATVWTAGGQAAWELDFFGRLRSLSNAAIEQYLATEEGRRAAQIGLVAQVATQYLTARALDDQLALARQTLELVQSSYDLTKRSADLGKASELDLRTAESQLQTARYTLSTVEQQRAQAENALALLVGAPMPAEPAPRPLDAQTLVADLPAGVPSEVLLRRPDVLSAEHALISANAAIGAARAAFFPTISLTGTLGSSSLELDKLFHRDTGFWSFVPRIDVPIFRGGALEASLDAARVRKHLQVARYERAIQGAFREVSDALAVRAAIGAQLDALTARVAAEQKRYELSDLRYRTGIDSYLTVLTAQRDLFAAQQLLIQTRLARLSNLVDLYRALGGGWQERTAVAAR